MTEVLLIAGIICAHIVWSFLNTLQINNCLFKSLASKVLLLAFNWLIPLLGPLTCHFILRKTFNFHKPGHPVKDSTGGGNLYSGNEGMDSGCGSD